MNNFTLHILHIETQVLTPILLNQHKGSALRGALYHALRGPDRPSHDGYTGFCTNKAAPSCWECPLNQVCPVSALVATLSHDNSAHGRHLPRPYVIRPPLDNGRSLYQPGETFSFGVGLCADALQLFPYVVLSLERLQHEGLGKRHADNDYRRGRLAITRMTAIQPLTGEIQEIRQAGSQMVNIPDLPATHADVLETAATLPDSGRLAFHFRTPTRIIHRKQTLKTPVFRPLFHRLIFRLEQLSEHFSDTPLELDVPPLLELADKVQLVEDQTRWIDLKGYSTRRRRETLLGGLVGTAVFQADDWTPFLPWLVWGSLLGVGKNTVKGDGWYSLEGASSGQ